MTKDELKAIAQGVAILLPGKWDYEPTDSSWGESIIYNDGQAMRLNFRDAKQRNRVEISADGMGLWSYRQAGDEFPRITVTPSKTLGQIAKDIERRILPGYAATLVRCTIRKSKEASQQMQRIGMMERFAAMLHDQVSANSHEPKIYCWGRGGARIEVSAYSTTQVRIELSAVPQEAAETIIAAIASTLRYDWEEEAEGEDAA